ncbi:MAG: chorismate mutase [Henriciella sp.]|nr:chorismate mutase [Henriciella sp.]
MDTVLKSSATMTAETAETMPEVRKEIDRLDRQLVALMAERQGYMDAAARIKGERAAVHDRARIEDVVAKVVAEAKKQGLSPAIAEPVWRTLIDRSIAYEFESFDSLKPGLDKA